MVHLTVLVGEKPIVEKKGGGYQGKARNTLSNTISAAQVVPDSRRLQRAALPLSMGIFKQE